MIEQIRSRLSAYAPRELPIEEHPLAAVLVPIYLVRDELHVVLTKRTDRVEHHKGEISFPGGARDPGDLDLMTTALRESHEEIGLDPRHVEIVGRIDHFVTVSRFHVSPFVGVINPEVAPYPWRPQEQEVAEILEVPLAHLLDPSSQVLETRTMPDGRVTEMESFRWGRHLVWGATARILKRFLQVALPGVEGLEAEPAGR